MHFITSCVTDRKRLNAFSECLFAAFLFVGVGVFFFPSDWVAWLLMAGTPFFLSLFEITRREFQIIFFILGIHFLLALLRAHGGVVYVGSSLDVDFFHREALGILNPGFSLFQEWFSILTTPYPDGHHVFIKLIALIYAISPSFLAAEIFCVWLFSIALILFSKLQRLLETPQETRSFTLLVFGLVPQNLLWTSTLLSESFQLLLLLSLIYFGLRFRLSKGFKQKGCFAGVFLFTVVLFSLSHKGFSFLAMGCLILFLLWNFEDQNLKTFFKKNYRKIFFCLVLCLIVFKIETRLVPNFSDEAFARFWENQATGLGYIFEYRSKTLSQDASTNYIVPTDLHGVWGILKSLMWMVMYYTTSPWPWQVDSLKLFFLGSYAWFRLVCFAALLFCLPKISPKLRWRKYLLLITLFIGINLLFSLGTTNYGTALRHSMLSDWILFLIGIPCFIERLKLILKRWRMILSCHSRRAKPSHE